MQSLPQLNAVDTLPCEMQKSYRCWRLRDTCYSTTSIINANSSVDLLH